MAKIRSFCAVRPKETIAGKIAALPYDVYNREETREEIDIYSHKVYEKAVCTLREMIDNNEFVQDATPNFYLYERKMYGRFQTGVVGCTSIDDYLNNVIMIHENTRLDKEEDRTNHIDVCNAQTGPILLTYRPDLMIQKVMYQKKKEKELYGFVAEDGVTHCVWKISRHKDIEAIQKAFESIVKIYIADRHHRAASAVKVGLKRRAANPDYSGNEEFNYFLTVLFLSDEFHILDNNRVVFDLNGYTAESFKEKMHEEFKIETYDKEPYTPEAKGMFGMYLNGL